MYYFIYALTAIAAIDLILLIIRTVFGSASDFVYYLCRPFGISCISMFTGFIIRILEGVLIGISFDNIVKLIIQSF